jgi:hypothetical protein
VRHGVDKRIALDDETPRREGTGASPIAGGRRYTPRPVFSCSSSIIFDASAFGQDRSEGR